MLQLFNYRNRSPSEQRQAALFLQLMMLAVVLLAFQPGIGLLLFDLSVTGYACLAL